MRALVVLIAAAAILSVQAGVLFTETSFVNGTTIEVTWLQGVERADVRFTDGSLYRENMTLVSGPNRCFDIGADGNDHAIVIEAQSDDRGPNAPDAVVDCRICGCEDTPGTRYTCTSDGSCAACDPCEADTCNTGEVCVRETCNEARCTCDPIQCSGRTCEDERTVTSACAQDRCESTSRCIKDSCGAECNSGSVTTRSVCDGDVLYRETVTCSDSCEERPSRELLEDCSDTRCGPGEDPVCTEGGCACV